MVVHSSAVWGALKSPRWGSYPWVAGIAFTVGIALFLYGGLYTSTVWMLAPAIGLIFLPLSLIARTWGWALAFSLLTLVFPLILALQGI